MKDETADDLAAFGAPPEIMDAQPIDGAFDVWPENIETVTLFLRLQTQWIVGAMGGVLGLNYQAVEALFNILGINERARVFDGLQSMERAALPVLNGRKD